MCSKLSELSEKSIWTLYGEEKKRKPFNPLGSVRHRALSGNGWGEDNAMIELHVSVEPKNANGFCNLSR